MSDESLKLRACLAALLLLAPLLGGAAAWAGAAAAPGGSWVGTYTLVGQDDVAIELGGGHARVALGAGHAGLQTVSADADAEGGRVRFSLPGVPAPVVFDLRPTARA